MPKNVAIGLGGLVALLALALVFMGGKSEAPVTAESDAQTAAVQDGVSPEVVPTEDGIFEGTFSDLQKRSGNFECAFNDTVNGNNSTGVVYLSGGKMRLNYSATVADAAEPMRGAMIQKDGTLYMWSDAMPQGIKMAVKEGQAVSNAPTNGELFDQNLKMKYSCKTWTPNVAWFEVPPTIEFMSL